MSSSLLEVIKRLNAHGKTALVVLEAVRGRPVILSEEEFEEKRRLLEGSWDLVTKVIRKVTMPYAYNFYTHL